MTDLYIIDTDISLGTPFAEIDDGAALICLRRSLGERVLAVTTVHGNVDVQSASWNAQRLCAYLDWDVPVYSGADRPLLEDPSWFAGWQAGYGPTPPWPEPAGDRPAAEIIVDLVRAYPGRITLVALGPLTNLAAALSAAPDIAGLVREVVCMGGSGAADDPAPEFNFRSDPEAAHIALLAGWPLRLFGLEITRQVFFSRVEFEALPAGQPAVDLLKQQAPGWIDRVEAEGWESGGCSLHDAAPVAALIDPSLFAFEEANVSVELAAGGSRGRTHLLPGKGVRAAAAIREAACRELVYGLLKGDHQVCVCEPPNPLHDRETSCPGIP